MILDVALVDRDAMTVAGAERGVYFVPHWDGATPLICGHVRIRVQTKCRPTHWVLVLDGHPWTTVPVSDLGVVKPRRIATGNIAFHFSPPEAMSAMGVDALDVGEPIALGVGNG